MKLEQFKEEIKKLGFFLRESENFFEVRYYPFKRTKDTFDCVDISKHYSDNMMVRPVQLDSWSRSKQKELMQICVEFAMTDIKER